jgi:hypothetical protein
VNTSRQPTPERGSCLTPSKLRQKPTGQRAFRSGRRCGEHRLPGELVVVRLSLRDGHGSHLFGRPLRPR